MEKIKVGIIGAAGYTGGELIRSLLHHPETTVAFANSRSNAGKPVHSIHQDLIGDTDLVFTADIDKTVDVVFLCLGHGESAKFLSETTFPENVKIIDLANDFRLQNNATIAGRTFVYGLPELNRDKIKKANNIANPGCFATAIQLGLLPLAQKNLVNEVYTTGITGSTGAGQSLTASSHFSWRANNIQAYKTLSHQHLAEIAESIVAAGAGNQPEISFVPWRGDFSRGIFISSTISCDLKLEELYSVYEEFYKSHPFTVVSREPIFLKQVVNTNKAIIQLEKAGTKLVVHSIIDNLLKGAVGQAIQNMNLIMGLTETTGLQLKANYF